MQGQNRGYSRGRGFCGGRGRSRYSSRKGYGYNPQGSAGPSRDANSGNVHVNAAYSSYNQGLLSASRAIGETRIEVLRESILTLTRIGATSLTSFMPKAYATGTPIGSCALDPGT
jgi:hypothetical protein